MSKIRRGDVSKDLATEIGVCSFRAPKMVVFPSVSLANKKTHPNGAPTEDRSGFHFSWAGPTDLKSPVMDFGGVLFRNGNFDE